MLKVRRLIAVAFPLLLVTLLHLPAAAETGEADLHYRLSIGDPGSGTLEVTLQWEADSRPAVLTMEESYGDGLAVDLSSHIKEERVEDEKGELLPFRREGGTWYIEGDGVLVFSYRVDLSGYSTGNEYLETLALSGAWPYFPFLEPDLAYLPGYALFVHPPGAEGLRPAIRVETPPGWKSAFPWESEPENLRELLYNPIFAGDITLLEEDGLAVALPASSPSASSGLEEYLQKTRRILSEGESLFGAGRESRLLAVLLLREETHAPEPFYIHPAFYSSLVIPDTENANILSDAFLESTARALAHLLFARRITVAAETEWFREGTAWYLQDILPLRAGLWGASTAWDRFIERYGAYRAAGGKGSSLSEAGLRPNEDPGDMETLCLGGAGACAAVDSLLAEQQPLALRLSDVLAGLPSTLPPEEPLTNTFLEGFLEDLTGRKWSSFFEDYVRGSEKVPPSLFSSLKTSPSETPSLPGEVEENPPSTGDWVLLAVAVGAVFLLPFILEPYTMRPRKPGFLKRILEKED